MPEEGSIVRVIWLWVKLRKQVDFEGPTVQAKTFAYLAIKLVLKSMPLNVWMPVAVHAVYIYDCVTQFSAQIMLNVTKEAETNEVRL